MAESKLSPLQFNVSLVNPDGTPTPYFIQLLQQLYEEKKITDDAVTNDVIAGAGLSGGGALADGPVTLTADVQAILNLVSTTRGAILYRGAAAWSALLPGAAGQFLQTAGAGADPSWAAAGGGGGGSSGFGNIIDSILLERTKAQSAAFGAGSIVDKAVTHGDLTGLLVDYYGSSGAFQGGAVGGARMTVPAGKIAFLLYFACHNNVRNNATFYKHRLFNITTATAFNAYNNNAMENDGFALIDAANSIVQYPVKIGVAGDVIQAGACSAGDGNTRTVHGFYILACADAATGIWTP